LTERSENLAGIIGQLYEGGLSRQEIRVALNNRVSERYVREITSLLRRTESQFYHDESKREMRLISRGIAHNPKDFGAVYTNKMIGRGMAKVRKTAFSDEKFAEAWWRARARRRVEGS